MISSPLHGGVGSFAVGKRQGTQKFTPPRLGNMQNTSHNCPRGASFFFPVAQQVNGGTLNACASLIDAASPLAANSSSIILTAIAPIPAAIAPPSPTPSAAGGFSKRGAAAAAITGVSFDRSEGSLPSHRPMSGLYRGRNARLPWRPLSDPGGRFSRTGLFIASRLTLALRLNFPLVDSVGLTGPHLLRPGLATRPREVWFSVMRTVMTCHNW
jgi:hypothetical protein